MQTIYLSRTFQPVIVSSPHPGDVHADPVLGDCRRLTAKRLCLAAERAGKESVAVLGLLRAICDVAEKDQYDGRAVDDWYGLIGLPAPVSELIAVVCPRCGINHYAREEKGKLWNDGLCLDCGWERMYAPKVS